jgi:hypothetical protein
VLDALAYSASGWTSLKRMSRSWKTFVASSTPSPCSTWSDRNGAGRSSSAIRNLSGSTCAASRRPSADSAAPYTAPASHGIQGFWIEAGVRRMNATSDLETRSTIQRNQSEPVGTPPSSLLVE